MELDQSDNYRHIGSRPPQNPAVFIKMIQNFDNLSLCVLYEQYQGADWFLQLCRESNIDIQKIYSKQLAECMLDVEYEKNFEYDPVENIYNIKGPPIKDTQKEQAQKELPEAYDEYEMKIKSRSYSRKADRMVRYIDEMELDGIDEGDLPDMSWYCREEYLYDSPLTERSIEELVETIDECDSVMVVDEPASVPLKRKRIGKGKKDKRPKLSEHERTELKQIIISKSVRNVVQAESQPSKSKETDIPTGQKHIICVHEKAEVILECLSNFGIAQEDIKMRCLREKVILSVSESKAGVFEIAKIEEAIRGKATVMKPP